MGGVAEVPEEVAGLALQAGERTSLSEQQAAGGLIRRLRGGGVEPQREAREPLVEAIVKLPGDAPAFLGDGLGLDLLLDHAQLRGDPPPQ